MFEFLKHLLGGQNQFASGGLLLMLIGGVAASLRSIPKLVGTWLVQQTTMMITVSDDDYSFIWVKEWFLEQKFLTRIRRVDLDTSLRGAEMALIPAPGHHFFWRGRLPFWILFHRSEDTKGRSQRRIESLTFRTVGRNQSVLKSFVDEIVACHHSRRRMVSSLYVYDEGWRSVEAYSPRLLDSVILKQGEKEQLMQDLDRFQESHGRYRRLGIPYHRGYLFYGPPGTGKSSLASALAAKSGMSIYVINLTEFNDRNLKAAMNAVPEMSMILFEDIDCMKTGTRREDRNVPEEKYQSPTDTEKSDRAERFGVTLSGLLNVLDGVHAPDKVIYIMTTNHIEALDPALLRPGRIDYRLYMGHASESQRIELFRRFFPEASAAEASEFARSHCVETMAEFQGLLLAVETEWKTLEPSMESLIETLSS